MFVDLDDKETRQAASSEDRTDCVEPPPVPVVNKESYSLGSPLQKINTELFENTKVGSTAYRGFGRRLREFLKAEVVEGDRPQGLLTVSEPVPVYFQVSHYLFFSYTPTRAFIQRTCLSDIGGRKKISFDAIPISTSGRAMTL
jgi:hypothetical protein